MCNCDENDTRRKTVAELIREDLQSAAATTYDDLIDATEKRASEYAKRLDVSDARIKKLEMTMLNINAMMLDCAADLARAGGHDHKGKNEAILAVIARLLAYGNNPLRRAEYDDVPF